MVRKRRIQNFSKDAEERAKNCKSAGEAPEAQCLPDNGRRKTSHNRRGASGTDKKKINNASDNATVHRTGLQDV